MKSIWKFVALRAATTQGSFWTDPISSNARESGDLKQAL
jgi:hypothetical protein